MILHKMSPSDLVWIFAALAIFLGLFYLLKERRRMVVVPYIRVLREAMGKALVERAGGRWRRLCSFLIQAGLLFLAVLALADPEWDGQWGMVESQRVGQPVPQLVLLLDRSMSMDMQRDDVAPCTYPSDPSPAAGFMDISSCALGESFEDGITTFDVAKGRAAYLIHHSDPATRILLATLDRRVSVHAVWEDRVGALRALEALRRTDLEDAPRAARPWLQNLRDNLPAARINVITDLQRASEWAGLGGNLWSVEGVGKRGANLVLERFRVRADITQPGSAIARCSISYYGADAEPGEAAFTLEVRSSNLSTPAEQVVVAVERRRVRSGTRVDVDLELKGLPGGILSATVVAEDATQDSVRADSHRWAAVPALRPVRVGLIGESPPFLVAALVADPFVELMKPVENAQGVSGDTEIQLFVGQIPDRLTSPALIFHPPVENHSLGGVVELQAGKAKAAKHTFWKRFDPGEIAFDQAVALVPAKGERVLLSSGKAVVGTIGRQDGFPVIRLGLDPYEGQVGTSPFFPALVARAVDFLQTRLDLVGREYDVGHIVFDPEEDGSLTKLFSLSGNEVFLGGNSEHRTAWVERGGLYIAHDDSHGVKPVIVGSLGDRVEGVSRGSTRIEKEISRPVKRPLARSGLWMGLILALVFGMVVEHMLFVWRRVW